MSGKALKGHRGFATKEDDAYDAEIHLRIHRYVLTEAGALLSSGESLADFVRAAVREKITRENGR